MRDLSEGAKPNVDLFGCLDVQPGDLIQALLPGARFAGRLNRVEGDVVVLDTIKDEPPMQWALNPREIIAAGRVMNVCQNSAKLLLS